MIQVHLKGLTHALIIATLNAEQAKHLGNFPPKADGRVDEASLVRIDERPLPYQVHLVGLDDLGLLDHLPDNVKQRDEDLHRVVRPELRQRPGLIRGVAVQDGDEDHPDQRQVSAVGLEPAVVGEAAAVDILRFAGAVEADVSDRDDNIVDQSCSSQYMDILVPFLGGREVMNSPPAVTRLANHVITMEELFDTCRKDRIGKTITIMKQ